MNRIVTNNEVSWFYSTHEIAEKLITLEFHALPLFKTKPLCGDLLFQIEGGFRDLKFPKCFFFVLLILVPKIPKIHSVEIT